MYFYIRFVERKYFPKKKKKDVELYAFSDKFQLFFMQK